MSLQGKIAVITGASRGIGRAIALRLAEDGAFVVVNYQKNAEAAVCREIEAAGDEAFALQGDVGSVQGIGRFFQSLDSELTKRHGNNQFILILAAELGKRGITVNAVGPGLTVTDFTAHARQDPSVVQHLSAHTALVRLGEAEHIAGAAAWLASDDARWVTGQYIEASGGTGLV